MGKGGMMRTPAIAENMVWCEYCWLRDKTKALGNSGGECCALKKKRPYGKDCEWWIRDKEG
jgi:hypothetical protein